MGARVVAVLLSGGYSGGLTGCACQKFTRWPGQEQEIGSAVDARRAAWNGGSDGVEVVTAREKACGRWCRVEWRLRDTDGRAQRLYVARVANSHAHAVALFFYFFGLHALLGGLFSVHLVHF